MLVSQLIKSTLNIQGFRVSQVQGDTQKIIGDIVPDRRHLLFCSSCGSASRYRDTLPVRHYRHVPIWGIPVWLRYCPRRVRCEQCGIKVEYLPWCSGKQRFTTAFAHFLAAWAGLLPWKQVANLFDCSWVTVPLLLITWSHMVWHIGISLISPILGLTKFPGKKAESTKN